MRCAIGVDNKVFLVGESLHPFPDELCLLMERVRSKYFLKKLNVSKVGTPMVSAGTAGYPCTRDKFTPYQQALVYREPFTSYRYTIKTL